MLHNQLPREVPTYIPDYDKWAGEKFKEELEMLKSTLSKEE